MPSKSPAKNKSHSFPLVAIGASAGGLEAITALLDDLPANTGMAYVYIQHLDPNHKSKLSEILMRHTKMKVLEAKNRLSVKVDHLYIIPPNKSMTLIDGVISLGPRQSNSSPHMPIDKFFKSLAEKHQYAPIGIVLSGNASDGTLGLKSIKMAGGITMVQDQTARFQSMPKSAIAEGVVDIVLPPQKIAHELARISSDKAFVRRVFANEEPSEINKDEVNTILDLLKKATSVDFSNYKINTIQRRIIRRMLIHKCDKLKDYIKYLQLHTAEIHALHHDLLINVTSFFRDPDSLEYLQKSILPKLLKSKQEKEALRIWIPACSTGEEAYSLAIIINEIVGGGFPDQAIQIFATDLSESAIAKARIGLYSKADVSGVSEKRLSTYFNKVDSSYRVIKSIRDICVFAPHNIFRDPPFSRMDLITCCNLMIYLENPLQKRLLHLFHYSLNPDGYLQIGKSETVATSSELFLQVEKRFKVFSKKKEVSNSAKFELRFPTRDRHRADTFKTFLQKPSPLKENRLEKTVDAMLLSSFVPACVLVNDDLDILQFRGSTGIFLEPSPGKASLNLLKMAKAGLAFELKNAIHKSSKSRSTVKKTGIEIRQNGKTFGVSIEVVPVKYNGDDNLFLVVFNEENLPASVSKHTQGKHLGIISNLKEEIINLKEDMRSMIEEREAHVEELQSANEEIISSNEELQSINEELETSKEEIESTNEELSTINAELQVRNDQLSESYEYSSVMFDIIREAVIVLTQDFRVKAANRSFYTTFGVTEEETEGKLIYELGNRQWDIHYLRQALENVLEQKSSLNALEVHHDFPNIGRKVMLINAKAITQQTSNQNLILLAIEDITEHRVKQQLLEEREIWFRNMANQAPVMIWVSGTDQRKNFFNETWLIYTGKKITEEEGIGWRKQIHADDLQRYLDIFNESYDNQSPFKQEYRLRRADGMYRWLLEIAKPIFGEDHSFRGFIGSCTEIHEKKMLNEELEQCVNERTVAMKEANQELERSNVELQQFAYVASHDLQEPLRKSLIYADKLLNFKEELPRPATAYIDKIIESSARMRSLIEELLDFSRISTQEKKYELVNLQELIQNLLADFEIVIKEKKARIKFNKMPMIEGIHIQMEQLFHNLISNALKFSKPNAAPFVQLTANELDKNAIVNLGLDSSQRFVDITVSDKGIGFSEDFKEKIFELFHRLNSKQDYPGTGIGLALCRKIVTNHGGKIYAASTEMIGAEFHVILPYVQLKKPE